MDSLPLLPKGRWAVYRGLICKVGSFGRPVLSLFSNDSEVEHLGFQKMDDGSTWMIRVDRDTLDRLVRVATVCEWRGALWSIMSFRPDGGVFLSWIQGSAQFEELQEKPDVEVFDRGLIGEPQFSEVGNVRSWVEDFDVSTGKRNGGDTAPDVADLCREFRSRNDQK